MKLSRKVLSQSLAVVLAIVVNRAASGETPSLREVFAKGFVVGAAISNQQIAGEDPAALELAARQFNTITPENLLKWESVHPRPDEYHFEPADRYVEFGEKHGMFIVGHTLVWHNQTPDWVFADAEGQPADREFLLARMREHIRAVVGRYKGRIHAWDVVNEALDDRGNLRPTKWRQIIGPDYIEHAFRFAHEADPDAELYYNDFNEWKPGKRRAIGRLVRNLKSKGIRIDGIGMQGHWGMDYPTVNETQAMLNDYGRLGVKLMITELDINLLPQPEPSQHGADIERNYELRKKLNPYPDGLPHDVEVALTNRYAEIFRCLHEHRDKIDRVTFWGVHDGVSWLNYWPVPGRTAYPLLFDRELKPKPAFHAVIGVAEP